MIWFSQFFSNIPISFVAICSLIVAFLAYIYQKNQLRKSRACDIAKIYAMSIIPKSRFVTYVMEDVGLLEVFRDVEISKFDTAELTNILKKKNLSQNFINDRLDAINVEIIKKACVKSCIDNNEIFNYTIVDDFSDKNKVYSFAFRKFIYNLLNELESIAIQLCYNIADEKIIYQPLHQSYLERMVSMYYFIAVDNYQDENRYYTSLVWLYREWKNRSEQIKQRISNSSKKPPFKGARL